uniref:Uncharacterized protein n=1 Tax=Magallana gigas TaxID=29159 RepID=A0A8W8P1Z7_MAGGI
MATKRERSINLSQSEISILTELFDKNEDALKEKQGYLITKNAKWTEVTEMKNEVGIQRRTGDQTGRGVPVLIPNETNKVLEYLSNPVARQRAIIRPDYNYMFANTGE